eukprot:scaffold41943_cov91-Phaeocystis_antarctica.AAC.2
MARQERLEQVGLKHDRVSVRNLCAAVLERALVGGKVVGEARLGILERVHDDEHVKCAEQLHHKAVARNRPKLGFLLGFDPCLIRLMYGWSTSNVAEYIACLCDSLPDTVGNARAMDRYVYSIEISSAPRRAACSRSAMATASCAYCMPNSKPARSANPTELNSLDAS